MSFRFFGLLPLLFIQIFSMSVAAEVTLNAGVEAELIEQKTNVELEGVEFDSTSRVIAPYAAIYYEARDVNFRFRGTHNHVSRGLELDGVTNNYTDFIYSSKIDLIRNVLQFDIGGNQGYRSDQINSVLSDDFLLNAANLSKVSSNRAALSLNLNRGDYFGAAMNTNYDRQNAEPNSFNPSVLDNSFNAETYSGNISLFSGRKLTAVQIRLNGVVNYSKRINLNDFVSHQVNFSTNFRFHKNIAFVFSAAYDNNEIKFESDSEIEDNTQFLREFYSVGAGLNWQSRPSRNLSILWNRSFNDPLEALQVDEQQDKEEDNFISATIDWEFSPRTRLNADYSRRLYGDSGSLSFLHSLRNWRSRITYNEQVTTNSRLVNTQSLGLFVCENGAQDISQCSLSDALEPNLEAGQFIQAISIQNAELNDRIVLSKRLVAQSGFTRRRTTISVLGSVVKNEEVEINRQIETKSIGANISFNFSRRTKLVASYKLSDSESLLNDELSNSRVKDTSIKLTRSLNRKLDMSLGLRYLDNEGTLNQGPNVLGIRGPFTDRRITFSMSYNYGNRR